MCCEQIERQLGLFVDHELSATDRREVEAHLAFCSNCRAELEELRELTDGIALPDPVAVPVALWADIARRLDQTGPVGSFVSSASPAQPRRRLRSGRGPWSIAAGVVLAVGLGILGLSSLDTTAQASTVDFGVLLDALPLDAQKAFRKFLVRYDAKPITPVAAQRVASNLNFATPAILPGGFRLRSVYELRIGGTKGMAAVYDRGGEFLGVVFHAPMEYERFGSHENYACVIGEHCGHKVQVGEWKLVHLTDATTCHCLLSRLDEQREMPAVMQAIAPNLADAPSGTNHAHP